MNPFKPLRSMERKKKLDSQYIQYPLSGSSTSRPDPKNQKFLNQSVQDKAKSSSITSPNLQGQSKQLSPNGSSSNLKAKVNPFVALSELKATEEQYEMLRKRMQVLKLKQQKNNSRSQLNHRKILLHSSIQKLASLQKQRLNQWKMQNQERVQSQRYSNLQEKLIHHKSVKEVEENLMENKLREYEQRKQQAKYHEYKIKEIQAESVQANKIKVDKIKKLELFSKLSIEFYNKQKLNEFKDKKFKETGSLEMKKVQKQLEIKKLLELEMEMVERQSRSRILFDSSTEKLKQILNPEANLRSSRISKRSPIQKMNYTELSQEAKSGRYEQPEQTFSQPNVKKSIQSEHIQKISSDSVTKATSPRGSQMKSGFSLPQIRAHKKFN